MRDNHEESHERLLHIAKAITGIEQYVISETEISFCEKDVSNDAVLFQFSIIGEASIYVETEKLDKYDYLWYQVHSFRNLIAHEHFNVNLQAVWQIIIKDLLELKKIINQMLTAEF